MFPSSMSSNNPASLLSEELSASSCTRIVRDFETLNSVVVSTFSYPPPHHQQQPQKIKKKRNLPGNPDPDAEVVALSPKTLLATNRFVCEICNKGFQRDQNLQLHRRGHNLPWKLKQRNSKENRKRAYVCPEPTCVHHHPSRALGDLTGIKKHFCRKHGEKKWKCEKCSKIYAVQSDWKAHSKTCGTREYRCDCGTLFSRKDSFITHRAFCDALAEESARISAHSFLSSASSANNPSTTALLLPQSSSSSSAAAPLFFSDFSTPRSTTFTSWDAPPPSLSPYPPTIFHNSPLVHVKPELVFPPFPELPQKNTIPSFFMQPPGNANAAAQMSATALLQKAATFGATASCLGLQGGQPSFGHHVTSSSGMTRVESGGDGCQTMGFTWQQQQQKSNSRLTRDFLGLTGDENHDHHHCGIGSGGPTKDVHVLTYSRGDGYDQRRNESIFTKQVQGAFGFGGEAWGDC